MVILQSLEPQGFTVCHLIILILEQMDLAMKRVLKNFQGTFSTPKKTSFQCLFSKDAISNCIAVYQTPHTSLERSNLFFLLQLMLFLLLPTLLKKLPKKKRKKNLRKKQMTTWDPDFSTNVLGSNLVGLFQIFRFQIFQTFIQALGS